MMHIIGYTILYYTTLQNAMLYDTGACFEQITAGGQRTTSIYYPILVYSNIYVYIAKQGIRYK